jgi:hypothetical protein
MNSVLGLIQLVYLREKDDSLEGLKEELLDTGRPIKLSLVEYQELPLAT